MNRERVVDACRRCGRRREHYTRRDGSKVSPCVRCARRLARERAREVARDPARAAKRREAYRRYNASAKGRSRLRRYREGAGDGA